MIAEVDRRSARRYDDLDARKIFAVLHGRGSHRRVHGLDRPGVAPDRNLDRGCKQRAVECVLGRVCGIISMFSAMRASIAATSATDTFICCAIRSTPAASTTDAAVWRIPRSPSTVRLTRGSGMPF